MGIRTPVAGSEGRQDIQATLWAQKFDLVALIFGFTNSIFVIKYYV